MTYSKIIGTGSYLPEKILTNADLEKMVDTTDQWITDRTGIKRRHILSENETLTDMVVSAALAALEAADLSADEIDLIVVGTSTPDKVFPSTACLLQERLGIAGCPAMDVNAACAGFIYALSIADKFVRCHEAKKALVIGAEAISRVVDWKDRSTCVLFGDGAGAVVIAASDEPGILSTHVHADGSYSNLLYAESLLANLDVNPYVFMKGREVFKIAVEKLEEVVDHTLERNHLSKEDIDWLIPHQANLRILLTTAKKLHMPMERVIQTIQEQGNTSAASVPLALDEGIRSGKIKRGELLLLEAVGAGIAWGSAMVRY